MQINRRNWCISLALLPQIAGALQQAKAAAVSKSPEWKVLDADSARDVDALACAIIPSDDGPGAREAAVIYFIDEALATFGADDLPEFRMGLAEVQKKRAELFAGSHSIALLELTQLVTLMRAIEHSEFFDLLRTYTVYGFLGNPSYGGNRDQIGWTQIGFEHRMTYSHPFGYYDAESK
jgi:hypothetical protein